MKRQVFGGLLAISFVFTPDLFAQGTAFTYQGRLNDSAGPANGLYDFRFTVQQAASGGAPASGTITTNGLAVSNGLFTVSLNFGAGVFTGPARWLQIEVRTNGSPDAHAVLTPRQALTASPYAIYSGTAATVASNSIGNAQLQGNSIYATNVVSGQVVKSVNGLRDNVTLSAGANVTLTPSGNDIQISSGTGNDWRLTGNAGTIAGTHYVGTSDAQPLELRVNGTRALRLAPTIGTPNVLGGVASVAPGVQGATIGGGGSNSVGFGPNIVNADFGTIGGGRMNEIQTGSFAATVGGGSGNWIREDSLYSAISGGVGNIMDNSSSYGFIGGGSGNFIRNDVRFGAVGGGALNEIGSFSLYSSVGGGLNNFVAGNGTTVAGGSNNFASGSSSAIGGGRSNRISGSVTVIAGGENNFSQGTWNSIGGGERNRANLAVWGVIAGGHENVVGSQWATVGGGTRNVATNGFATTIAGGSQNLVMTHYGTVGGGFANDIGPNGGGSVIAGGELNTMSGRDSVISGGMRNTVASVATNAVIGGGGTNLVTGRGGVVSGGERNESADNWSAVGGGVNNRALGESSAVGGGSNNDALGGWNAIGGGAGNTSSQSHSTVGGGWVNTASNHKSTVGGGSFNVASGFHATVPGGANNQAQGDYSLAAGRSANAAHDGAFVWADDLGTSFSSTTNRQFAVRANHGVMIQSTNTALDLRGGGALRVAGANVGTATPVFTHRAAAGNISGHITTIDHPHSNNDPNAILFVTHNWSKDDAVDPYETHPVGVYYASGRWRIFHEDGVAMPEGRAFNVMIFKP